LSKIRKIACSLELGRKQIVYISHFHIPHVFIFFTGNIKAHSYTLRGKNQFSDSDECAKAYHVSSKLGNILGL
jgi:hypothetical protein